MKKLLALILIFSSLFMLFSCKKDTEYPEVESTEEEAKTVMTITVDSNKYEVKYELYRALFLNFKSEVDGGNPDVWTGADKDAYIQKIDSMIIDRVCEIYAAFAICKRIGFNVYSKEVEKKIKENIKTSVEGGSYGSSTIQGYASYDDYLAALKKSNLNYSVQTLLFRYAIAVDAIDTYYIGTASSDDVDINMSVGKLEYTKDDVKTFYDGDDCVRVLRASFQKIISYTPYEDAVKLQNKLTDAANSADTLEEKEVAVFNAIMSSGRFSSVSEVEKGYVIGRYNLDRFYYGEMTNAAFTLEIGEVSEPIEIVTDKESSYYVIFKALKSEEHFEANYDSIKYIYLMNCVGKITYDTANTLKSSVVYTDFLKNIDHSGISM